MKRILQIIPFSLFFLCCQVKVNNLPCIFGDWKVVSVPNNLEENSVADFHILSSQIQPGTKISVKREGDMVEVYNSGKSKSVLYFDQYPEGISFYESKDQPLNASLIMRKDSLFLHFCNYLVTLTR